jgi:serine/threonine-protein kinase RsbT
MARSFSHSYAIRGKDFLEAGNVSTEIKRMLKELGVNREIVRRVAIATYEAEMNVVMYASEATVTVELTPEFIRIVVDDQGPGIPDVNLAMQEGYSTATPEMREMGFGAGMGLPNIKRNADRFNVGSVVGKGTRLDIVVNIN